MLNGLVLANGAAEHDAVLGVLRRALDRRATEPHGLRGDQDTLGVHAVQDVLEALAFLADAILDRNVEAVEEHLI